MKVVRYVCAYILLSSSWVLCALAIWAGWAAYEASQQPSERASAMGAAAAPVFAVIGVAMRLGAGALRRDAGKAPRGVDRSGGSGGGGDDGGRFSPDGRGPGGPGLQ